MNSYMQPQLQSTQYLSILIPQLGAKLGGK